MGEVVTFPRRFTGTLSKTQFARMRGRSRRWVELRIKAGMPHSHDQRGYVRVDPNEVEAWEAGQKGPGGDAA